MTGDIRGANSARPRRRAMLACVMLCAVSACTSDDVLRPRIDVDMQTSAMQPALADPQPVVQAPEIADPAEIGSEDIGPDEFDPQEIATPDFDQQDGAVEQPDFGAEILGRADASRVEAPAPTIVPSGDTDPVLAGYPRMDDDVDLSPSMSADETTCRKQLKKLGVAFEELQPINRGGACRIDHPVKVSRVGKVDIKPAATLSCDMAEAFASWTKNELVPASRWRFFSAVKTIHQGSSYSCRNIAGTRTSSEHANGNAIDIMKLELRNGKVIDVRKPGLFAFRKRGLLNTVRADGCEYFTTVLGPGYNRDHADHFHFDIKSRRNGYRACR